VKHVGGDAHGADEGIGATSGMVWGTGTVQGVDVDAEVPVTREECGAAIGETVGLGSIRMSKSSGGGLPGEAKGKEDS
jgi:hypothetical protein